MHCKVCDSDLENGAVYCPNCGALVHEDELVSTMSDGESFASDVDKSSEVIVPRPTFMTKRVSEFRREAELNVNNDALKNTSSEGVNNNVVYFSELEPVFREDVIERSEEEKTNVENFEVFNNGIENKEQTAKNVKNNKVKTLKLGGGMVAAFALLAAISVSFINFGYTFSMADSGPNSVKKVISQVDNIPKNDITKPVNTQENKEEETPIGEDKYLEYSDISIFVPTMFEYTFDSDSSIMHLNSKLRNQHLSTAFLRNNYAASVASLDSYRNSVKAKGGVISREGAAIYKNLNYTFIRFYIEGKNVTAIILEVPEIGTLVSQVYTDYEAEDTYLETLYEIGVKSKVLNSSDSAGTGFATRFMFSYPNFE